MSRKKRNPNHSVGDHWKHAAPCGARNGGTLFCWTCVKSQESQTWFCWSPRASSTWFPPVLLCSRFVTWRGGGSNRETVPRSRTSGMAFIHEGLTAGAGSLFLNIFFKQVARQADSDPKNSGWKHVAQDRVAWLASRPAFVACALRRTT